MFLESGSTRSRIKRRTSNFIWSPGLKQRQKSCIYSVLMYLLVFSKCFETRRLHVMSPTAKPVMALYTWDTRSRQLLSRNQKHIPPDECDDLLLVTLKCDLAMVCLTTFGVTVVIFHFSSRLCSTGSSSTSKTCQTLFSWTKESWCPATTSGMNTAYWYAVTWDHI